MTRICARPNCRTVLNSLNPAPWCYPCQDNGRVDESASRKICHAPLTDRKHNKRYCSDACRTEAHRRSNHKGNLKRASACPRLVVGIDPGIANTGVVLLRMGRLELARSFTTAPGDDLPFCDVLRRAWEQTNAVEQLLDTLYREDLHVAVESYEDFGPHLRGAKNRWMTPMLLPLLDIGIRGLGARIYWQSPREVLTATKGYREHWKSGRRGLVLGDECLTNEHLRSAACHAVHLEGALRLGRGGGR